MSHNNYSIFDPLHSTLTTITYQSILKNKKGVNTNPPFNPTQQKRKQKYKTVRQSLPVLSKYPTQPRLTQAITSVQSAKSRPERSPILSIHGSMSYLQVMGKFKEKPLSIVQDSYFQRTRNSSVVDSLLFSFKAGNQ